jgi:hypothetical protein
LKREIAWNCKKAVSVSEEILASIFREEYTSYPKADGSIFLRHLTISITIHFYHTKFLSHYISITLHFYHTTFLPHYISITLHFYHTTFLSHYISITLHPLTCQKKSLHIHTISISVLVLSEVPKLLFPLYSSLRNPFRELPAPPARPLCFKHQHYYFATKCSVFVGLG